MIYEIDTSNPVALNWAATGTERVIQNVTNLINTWKYEIAYNRTIGIDPGLMDKPSDEAAINYTSQVYELISNFEPRAAVQEVTNTGIDENGNMVFKVVISVE